MLALLLALVMVSAAPAWARDSDETFVSEAELDQLLAPVALYPDSVLSHLLIASTYPLEVVMAERWTREHPDITGKDALDAVEHEDWDPSVKALVAFPDLLERMSEDLDWTESLGEAFLADEEGVLDRVQMLRQKAYDTGSLDDLEHLSVSRTERHIVIEPVVREVIYIPYYDSRVVYGRWWWSDYPPHYWHYDHRHYDRYGHTRRVYWGPRVSISWHFFFSGFHWHQRRLVVVDHDYYWHDRHQHRFWRAEQVARYRDARHWRHNPYHRRGVVYRNPRTRDYFEGRHREQGDYQRRHDERRHDNVRSHLKRREQGTMSRQYRTAPSAERSGALNRERRQLSPGGDVRRFTDDNRERAERHAREHKAATTRTLRQPEQRSSRVERRVIERRATDRSALRQHESRQHESRQLERRQQELRRTPQRSREPARSGREYRGEKRSHLKAQ